MKKGGDATGHEKKLSLLTVWGRGWGDDSVGKESQIPNIPLNARHLIVSPASGSGERSKLTSYTRQTYKLWAQLRGSMSACKVKSN